MRKGEISHYEHFSFSHSVFKRLILQTRQKQGFVWGRVNVLYLNTNIVTDRKMTEFRADVVFKLYVQVGVIDAKS